MRALVWLPLSLLLAGCSSAITVKEFDPRLPPGAAVDGIPVRVPRTYNVRLYMYDPDKNAYTEFTITGDKTVTIGDPEHLYAIGFKGQTLSNPTFEIKLNDNGGIDHVNLASASQGQAALTELGTQIGAIQTQLATNRSTADSHVDDYASALGDYYSKLADYCTASKATPVDMVAVKGKAAALYGSEIKLRRAHDTAKSTDVLPFATLVNPEIDVGVGCPTS